MKLQLKGKVLYDLDMVTPLRDGEGGPPLSMARALARILTDSHNEDPAKCLEIARRLYAEEDLDLDTTDMKMVERVVRAHRRLYLGLVTGALALEILKAMKE